MSRHILDTMFRRLAVTILLIAVSPSLALAHAQLEMSGTITTVDTILVDFNLANSGGIPSEALFATYSHSSGTSESRGITYPAGGIDSVLDLYTAAGGFISTNDDLTSPPGTRDSEIASFGGTPAPRPGFSPIGPLADGSYQLRLRPFSFGSLGNTNWSLESRLLRQSHLRPRTFPRGP